jgi:hypothetical protein
VVPVSWRRAVAGGLALAWGLLLAAHLSGRIGRLAGHWPRLRAGAAERAAIESGNPAFHAYLVSVARVVPAGSGLLFLAYDPRRGDRYESMRAAYELYPTRVRFVPVRVPLSARRRSVLPPDDEIGDLVRRDGTTLAAIWNRADPAGSGVASVALAPGGRLRLSPLAQETSAPAPAPPTPLAGPGAAVHPWGWPAGLLVVLGLGWAFNGLSGLAAPFAGDMPARLALAWLTGSGLTEAGMLAASLAGIPWSVPVCLAPWIAIAAWWGVRRRRRAQVRVPSLPPPGPLSRAGGVLVAASALLAACEAALPMPAWDNWDAWATWNFKAKAFWLAHGIPRTFLQDALFGETHPDYPPGVPLLQTFLGYCAGGLDERLLRAVSVAFFLMLAALLARLLLELGAGRWRWLAAGLFGCVPNVLDQASNGYVDLALAGAMTGAVLLLVRALQGQSPPWTVGLACGLAALIKPEGVVLGIGCLGLLVLRAWRTRTARKGTWLAVACAAGLMLPWPAAVRIWHLSPTFRVEPARVLADPGSRVPAIAGAVAGEMAGLPLEPLLTGRGSIGLRDWWVRVRDGWTLLWIVVAAALAAGARRLAAAPAAGALGALLVLQLGVLVIVFLGSQYDLTFILLTALDRHLLQLAPLAVALAAAGLAPSGRNRSRV